MYFSCVYDDDIRQYAGYNIALPGYGTIGGNDMVCNVNKSDLNYLIIHELAHTFGLKDGYNGDEPNCLGDCVMNGRPSLSFCDYCKTLLPN